MIDIPCKCGHLKKDHDIRVKIGDGYNPCMVQDEEGVYFMDTCITYIPDNLIYIEQESQRRHLV